MNRALWVTAVSAAFAVAAPVSSAQSDEAVAEAPAIVAQSGATSSEASGAQRAAPARRAFRNPSERVEARLAYIRTALKITDAQQPQWESFANVLRKHARSMDERIQQRRAQATQGAQRPDRRSFTAIERLERTQQRMAAQSARLNEVLGAAKPLYAALSPEQKQVADQMLARQGQRRGHGHHRGVRRGA
jgi:periplasmic protein CpxP/Spy